MTVMVVTVRQSRNTSNVAMLIVTLFCTGFYFYGHMPNSVFMQFLSHSILDFMRIPICNNMDCGEVVVTIQAPNVDMVNSKDAINSLNMFFDFYHVYVVRCFFEKQLRNFF